MLLFREERDILARPTRQPCRSFKCWGLVCDACDVPCHLDEYTVKLQKAIMYTIYLLSQNIKQLQSLRIRHHPGAIQ